MYSIANLSLGGDLNPVEPQYVYFITCGFTQQVSVEFAMVLWIELKDISCYENSNKSESTQ